MRAGTPRGFRDILPQEALARERITDVVRSCFSSHGYLPVETPLLEDRAVLERGGRIKDSPFQLFDADGTLLMLRPDLTLPVARLVAGRVGAGDLPARFRYSAPVVREEQSLRGQPRQFTQLGVELVGEDGAAAEVEVVRLLAEALTALEVPDWRIVFGSVTPLTALLEACAPTADFRERVLSLVHDSDLVTLDELISVTPGLSPAAARAIHELCRMGGGVEVIARLDALLAEAGVAADRRGTAELSALARDLADLFEQGRLSFDFSIINSFDYYTGIIFKGYAEGIAASLASGGRYDAVLANLGREGLAACGFALSLERLQEVLGEPGESGVVTPGVRLAERPLRIAVPKGSLFGDTVRALEAAGLPVAELEHPGRRLVVREGDVEYVIVRAQDAPAFVGHGGADCGICGKDSLIEANLDLLQLVDLCYGGCRFVVAEPASRAGEAERNYAWRGTVRVATKYPRITQGYYDSIGQQVDIVTLHGNIELGPIVGMADRIVDITATGTTLAENDLVIVDEVMECTARFFAGPAAYRCDRRIRDLAARLAEVGRGSES
ncbi:ATP phosphoribosyltransferase [Thermophilibacter provencensis]|uniref:ATP phosphoribosyltransferase regulatory subunit n=1 Tax=Thermophilibacter provencensis TaxID=1852386 RepID=A0ABT7V1Y6_9ACTN|nr:ATP phosphoribosyltransferase [Thermophilibacter provencensis]MDM8270613.1 ATP phosphoribosyltransferase [Thermophilibacter provencensis]